MAWWTYTWGFTSAFNYTRSVNICIGVIYIDGCSSGSGSVSPPPVCRPTPSITWHRKDGVLSQSRAVTQNYDRWLNFTTIDESDDGEYECRAKNTQGVATHTYTVTVEGMHTFRKWWSKPALNGSVLQAWSLQTSTETVVSLVLFKTLV